MQHGLLLLNDTWQLSKGCYLQEMYFVMALFHLSLFSLFLSPYSAFSPCLDIEVHVPLQLFFERKKIGFGAPPPLPADVSGWRSMGFFAACQMVLQAFAWTAVT